MPAAAVAAAITSGPFLPEDAKNAGLVDHIEHADFCKSYLEEKLGHGGHAPRYVPHASYIAPPGLVRRALRWRRPQVAIVHACGVLTSGDSRSSPSGSATVGARALSELLSSLRERPRVRAVVLRIDSPGGGALASDAIHRELSLVAKEKPVVVSMGDIAASGGYYIAAAAGTVLAEGTSLTGSIGVLGGKLVVKRLFDRLGIARESLSLGTNAGMFSPLRSFTEEERARHRGHLEHFYRARFLTVVAEGRKITLEEADEAGRGRVWTGTPRPKRWSRGWPRWTARCDRARSRGSEPRPREITRRGLRTSRPTTRAFDVLVWSISTGARSCPISQAGYRSSKS